ncbi:MAG: IPT/TIG domain-containing protein [Gammaproteobacteria bacterium]
MVISGDNFGSATPTIRLANQVLKVKSFSANQVVVSLPANIQPATYGLTVSTSGAYRSTSARFSAALFSSIYR